MRLYLDASAIIYGVEGTPEVRQIVLEWCLQAERSPNAAIVTSRLSRLECRVLPLRQQNVELLARYDEFFLQRSLTIIEIAASMIERATDLRVRHRLKTPDAIHVATAMDSKADLILTGDRDMAHCDDIQVELV